MKKSTEFEFPNMKLTTYSRLTQDQARKHDSHFLPYNNWRYMGYNNFQLLNLGKITRNYYTPVIYYQVIGNYLIKPESERYIIMKIIMMLFSIPIYTFFKTCVLFNDILFIIRHYFSYIFSIFVMQWNLPKADIL